MKIFVESFEIWLREAIKKEISLKLENFFLLPFFLILLPYWNQLLIRGECWSHAPATDQGRSWVWSWEWGDCPQEVVWRRYHQLTLDIRVSNRWSSSDLLNIFQPSSMSQLLYTSWFKKNFFMLKFKIWNSETIIILKYLSRLSRYMIIYQQIYILKKNFYFRFRKML